MKKLHRTMPALAGMALLGLSLMGCSGSEDTEPQPTKSESAPVASEAAESAVPETTQPAATDPEKGPATGSSAGQARSSERADDADGGKSLKKGFSDRVPDQVGEWKTLEGFAGLAAWGRDGGREAIIDATNELPATAKDMADQDFRKPVTRIDAGYCGIDENKMARCRLAVEGGTSIGLSIVKGAELDDLTEFAEKFTEAVPTN